MSDEITRADAQRYAREQAALLLDTDLTHAEVTEAAMNLASAFRDIDTGTVAGAGSATPELQCSGTVTTGPYVNSVSTAEDYARYAAAAMNAARADDTEFIADGATVTAYVHCLAHVSATFTLDEGRPYPGDSE